MEYGGLPDKRSRVATALLVVVLHGALGYMLVQAMGISLSEPVNRSVLNTFNIAPPPAEPPPPPPPPRIEKPAEKAARKEGASSPKNLRKKSAPYEAPKTIPKFKSKLRGAEKPGTGSQNASGASDTPGPGTGAGGTGNGTGSGNGGNGDGGGGRGGDGGGIAVEPKLIRGRITNKDYPKAASKIKAQGTVQVIYTVNVNGRVSGCRVLRSSRNADLDAITCRLIEERYVYEPARTRDGNPKAAQTMWLQQWWLGDKRKAPL
jgi:periplasmic protein TonB